jgi:hypothetical protein
MQHASALTGFSLYTTLPDPGDGPSQNRPVGPFRGTGDGCARLFTAAGSWSA